MSQQQRQFSYISLLSDRLFNFTLVQSGTALRAVFLNNVSEKRATLLLVEAVPHQRSLPSVRSTVIEIFCQVDCSGSGSELSNSHGLGIFVGTLAPSAHFKLTGP